MNAKNLLMIAFAAGLFVGCSQAANAQYAGQGGQKVSTDLQPATWFKARRQLQFVDETPDVTRIHRPKNSPIYVVVEPTRDEQAAPTVIYSKAPQTAGGGGQFNGMPTVPPGGALIDVSQLPNAGFSAYTPSALKRNPQGLPSGSSTNMLAGKMMTPIPQRTASSPSIAHPAQAIAMQPQQVATYGRTGPTPVSTNVSTQAKASVSATLLSKLHH